MARVTVEDCIEKVTNRFELVMVAAQRARRIGSGAALTLARDNDKNPVVALREIAESTVNTNDLKEELTRSHQRVIAYEEEEENIELMDGEAEWGTIAAQSAGTNEFVTLNDSDEDEEEEEEPSLEDLAGNPLEE